MQKSLLLLLLTTATLLAVTGETVFKKYCISCHKESVSGEVKMGELKAPPMNRISQHLKDNTKDKKAFVLFVKKYIQNPSKDKGLCMPRAFKKFGVMPAIGKNLSADERHAVAMWLYENFKDSTPAGKSCESKGKKSNASKCGAKKCGGAPAKTMRCGAGKCGGM